MSTQKIYAGSKLREVRTALSLTQKTFATKLGVSLSYLNQMENNHRPISAAVILGLAQEFGFDVTEFSVGESERVVTDMREALADPVFGDSPPPLSDLQLVASNAPAVARAFLNLHRAHRQASEQLASLNEALGADGVSLAPLPWEEVRDFFHYCDNYIDPIDRAAEHFADTLAKGDSLQALEGWLKDRHRITLSLSDDAHIRRFDPNARTLTLNAVTPRSTQLFQAMHQIAFIEHNGLLDATLDLARFNSTTAQEICKIGLANYFAGAAMMPYQRFLAAAGEMRHDLERLASRFGASVEQVAHRLSTLQRPGAKGVPFFFVRVDQAGTITKRHSATRLQFARFGGACPLWNVHRAFETPGRFLRQLAETPDGLRYFCLAIDVTKPGGGFQSPTRRYAIGLGCEVRHADALIYADDLDVRRDAVFEPIGISCRICDRQNCHQRALPPLERSLTIDHNARDTLPYRL